MIRLPCATSARLQRRQLLRVGFAAAVALGVTELAAAMVPYIRVTRIIGLGAPVAIGTASDILKQFAATNDRPILFREGRFFLLHAPGGIIAAYRKCTHLGCTVPFNTSKDLFVSVSRLALRQEDRHRPEVARPEAATTLPHHRVGQRRPDRGH